MPTTRFLLSACLTLLVTTLSGCANPESSAHGDSHDHGHDHDHGHGPESLHAAVAELTEMRDTIRDAILDGNPGKAHGPLHEVVGLLDAIPNLAAETDLPKEEWDTVKATSKELFDAFGVIDAAFHGKDGDKKAAYESVADKLDQGIEAIRSRLPLTGEDPETADHDHDHDHDHDEAAE